jgi:FixJ family two-component response regulator/HD-like signal output (HDOD) protein
VSGEQQLKEGTGGRPVVLVVDDEETVRVALTRNISRLGCTVVTASDGEEALRVAPELKPAVVFLDLRMPGLDGHALLRRLPERGVAASIVVMSGGANMDDVIDALRMGAVDFLKKPWSTSELASALERGIEVFRTLPQTPAVRTVAPGAWSGLTAHARSRTPRPDSAREQLLQRLQSQEPPAPIDERTVSHLHRSARDLDAANHARALTGDEIVHLLESDPGLATAVMRLANSDLYPGQDETQYLSTAVARLGPRMVHAVAETLALRDGYPIRAPELRTLHERIWRFSVARGLAMKAIAEVTGPEVALEPDRCYLGGLLLDAGAAFLLWTLDESRREPFAGDTLPPAAAEVLASFHPAFGQAVLSRWGMPGDLVALARDHHAPVPPLPGSPMWSASLLARPMAMRVVGFDDPSSPSQPRPELLDRCAYELGVGETVLRRLSVTLADDTRVHWDIYA